MYKSPSSGRRQALGDERAARSSRARVAHVSRDARRGRRRHARAVRQRDRLVVAPDQRRRVQPQAACASRSRQLFDYGGRWRTLSSAEASAQWSIGASSRVSTFERGRRAAANRARSGEWKSGDQSRMSPDRETGSALLVLYTLATVRCVSPARVERCGACGRLRRVDERDAGGESG